MTDEKQKEENDFVKYLRQEIKDLKQENKKLQQENKNLAIESKDNERLRKEIKDLQQDNKDLRQENARLKEEKARLEEKNKQLVKTGNKYFDLRLEKEKAKYDIEIQAKLHRIESLENDNDDLAKNLQTQVKSIRKQQQHTIGQKQECNGIKKANIHICNWQTITTTTTKRIPTR